MVCRTIDDKKEILKVIINRDKCKIDLDKITEFKKDTKIEFEIGRRGPIVTGKHSSYRDWETDRKSTRLNSSHLKLSRMPSSA